MVKEPRPLAFWIRPGRPADARACAAVMRLAVRAKRSPPHPARVLAAWSSLPPLYHRWAMGPGGESYFLAERGGRVLGYAALRGRELTAAFVRPAAQARGVGRALVWAAARAARRAGQRELSVLSARDATGFYSSLGFRDLGRARLPLPGGLELAAVRMRLRLSAGP